MTSSRTLPLTVATLLTLPFCAPAQETGDGAKTAKSASPADATAEVALKKLSVAPGLQVEVWASEPLLINPVAFCFDEKGRAFVVETGRRRSSVPDIRRHDAWRLENLGLRSVEERVAFLRAKLPASGESGAGDDLTDLNKDGRRDWHDLEVEGERIKLVIDSDGDGTADTAGVFADGFNSLVTGTAAGVVASGGSVWFACVPDLWRLDGETGGAAAKKTALLSGFGVHVAYGGHDMHGTKIGPDGRLYWTIADCGAHVTTREGKLIDNPDSGAVFRCNPDGTDMELFATGLRNPQSLAWNDVGDLFTGDNNADGGDAARWTHVVEGADYGWRIGWQFLPKLGAWNTEGLWHLDVDKKNYAILPPVGHVGHGPAGIAHYPGTGLPDAYRDHFFYADFPGGVRAFTLQAKGASYEVALEKKFQQDNAAQQMTGKLLWGLYPSDVQFGVDGGAYVLDWVFGWERTGKGRIYRVHDPAVDASPLVRETKRLLGEGMEKRDVPELAKLLAHADQRVRQAAQFELVRRGAEETLSPVANGTGPLLARLHAIWGLGQLGRTHASSGDLVGPILREPGEPRVQAIKVVGDLKLQNHYDDLLHLSADNDPRTRFFAAEALGKFGSPKAVPALLALLRNNAGSDAFVRHAATTALAVCADEKALVAAAGDESESVRAGVLLALRRQGSPEIARFLSDKNPQLVLEAARAIHDAPIKDALPALAELIAQDGLPPAVSRRVVNANFRLGHWSNLAKFAARRSEPSSPAQEAARLDAIGAIAQSKDQPPERDRVLGTNAEPRSRSSGSGPAALSVLREVLSDPSEAIRLAVLEMAVRLQLRGGTREIAALAIDPAASGKVRAAALLALDAMQSPTLKEAVRAALATEDAALLETARRLAAKVLPDEAVKLNAAVLGKGRIGEQQEALAALGTLPGAEADAVLAAQLDRLLAGTLPAPLMLDLLEAAAQRPDENLKRKLADFESHRGAQDPLAKWRECLEGGNAKAGREIFAEKAEAACMRCHKVKGEGGDVGPDLAGLIAKHDRDHLLQSIVEPNAVIAPGYENVLVTLKNGDMIAGLLNAEDANEVTLASLADGKKQQFKKADIKERATVPSAMPSGLGEVLGKRGLRDLIEYLATGK